MLARDRPRPTRDRPRPTPGPLPPDGGDLGGKPRPVRAIPGASRPRGTASLLPHWRRRHPFTNAIESASDQLRRATKNRGHSPSSDEAAVGLPWPPEPQQLRTRPRVRQGPGQAHQQTHRPPRQSHAPSNRGTGPHTCTTKALPAPLRPPTRRENQDPRRPKWRTSALSGAATLWAVRQSTTRRGRALSGAVAQRREDPAAQHTKPPGAPPTNHTLPPQPRTQAPESDRTATAPIPNNRADHHTTTPLCGTPLRPHRPPPVHSSSTVRRPRRSPCGEHLEDTAARARLISAPGEDCVDERPVVWTRAGSSVAGGRRPPLLVGREGPIDDGALGAGGGAGGVLAPAFAPASATGRFLVLLDGDPADEPAPWAVPRVSREECPAARHRNYRYYGAHASRARSTCSPRRAGTPTCCR